MEHFIIGTAGHIDHGKTSLIKALTKIDCDTHPEEKKRGITINLGFAYLKKDDGDYLAFVDVPGHHRFVANMVAGATGIDFVMLVIAADDGVMPQTKEHLKICSLLGIKNGIVVINKCDNADSDDIELCRDEISDFVKGTFLDGKPIFEVSSLTGKGIDELRNFLIKGDYPLTLRPNKDFFRMSIDRVFNVSGFGAIATGTVAQGEIHVGDDITVFPSGLVAKVRGIQHHSEAVESSSQGTRVALDLTGVKREDMDFGDILSSVEMAKSNRIDVRMILMDNFAADTSKFDAVMLCGTTKLGVKVKIIERFTENGNDCITAQIDLSKEWYFAYGDYFVLRNSSSDMTIAGGYIIDVSPLNHKKMTPALQSKMRNISDSFLAYIEEKVIESMEVFNVDHFVNYLHFNKVRITTYLEKSDKVIILSRMGNDYILNKEKFTQFEKVLMAGFEKFSRTNPLSVIGVSRKKLLEFLGDFYFYREQKSNDIAIILALSNLETSGKLERFGNQWRLVGARTEISDVEKKNIAKIENIILSYGYNPFEMEDIFNEVKSLGIDERSCKYILTYLTDLGKIVRVNGMCFCSIKLNEARNILISFLTDNKNEGIKVSEFRDLINSNRKISMLLLEVFDKEKIVVRRDDVRFLI